MKLPRGISGDQLVSLLRRYGYEPTRQTGSHVRLTSKSKGSEHHVTIPRHQSLRIGTLSAILRDLAGYLEISRDELVEDLFGP
ncbi:MAG TPA: type II toxin-antitoxin system HicA family toxin [Chloroflexota bacterium]|nr:type II toxin-antitoxin system HicA family toxin [Chloroflexota bacterium]